MKRMAFPKNTKEQKPTGNKLVQILFALIFFPFKVRKRYLKFNAVLWEAEKENKATQTRFEEYRFNNIKLLNIFIHTPLALCALVMVFMVYLEIDSFARVAGKIANPPKISLTKPKATSQAVKLYVNKISEATGKIRLRYTLYVFGGFYTLCFLGATLLAMYPAWKQERVIRDALTSNRYTDTNGEPWKVFWTPDAIIFHTYQCDPDSFFGNSKFWNTINFKPDTPVQFKNDANKIIVARAYALPNLISFEIKK